MRIESEERMKKSIRCKDFAILSGRELAQIVGNQTAKVSARLHILIFSTQEIKIAIIEPPRLLLKSEALNKMKDEMFASLWYDLKKNARQYEDISYLDFLNALKKKYSHVSVI